MVGCLIFPSLDLQPLQDPPCPAPSNCVVAISLVAKNMQLLQFFWRYDAYLHSGLE
jgi:hypothetical protein